MKALQRNLFLGFIIIIAVLTLGCKKSDTVIDTRIYAYVNGEAIIESEVDYFREAEKAKVLEDFTDKYGITDYSAFWETEYDGITPTEVLEERAFSEAVRAKIAFMLMKENGIYTDISYEFLRNTAVEFNNKNAGKGDGVGISSINMKQFYSYYLINGELELKNALGEGILAPTDEEIANFDTGSEDMTENMIKSKIVDGKYEKYIEDLINKAKIEKNEGE